MNERLLGLLVRLVDLLPGKKQASRRKPVPLWAKIGFAITLALTLYAAGYAGFAALAH